MWSYKAAYGLAILSHWSSNLVEAGGRTLPSINVPLPPLLGDAFGVPSVNRTFDYVVVGGGTAGLTIAYRLAKDYSVAVVEAGGFYQIDNGNGSTIPALAPLQFIGPSPDDVQPLIDWGFVTEPQAGANGLQALFAQGKTLGGSSARNFMTHHFPTVGSLDSWADAVGDESFSWDHALQYFEKSVTVTPANQDLRLANTSTEFDVNSFNMSSGGPLQITWPNYGVPFASWVAKGLAAVGLPLSSGSFLDGKLSGFSAWATSSVDPVLQQRSDSATTYLARALVETDLVVYTQTQATQILFDEDNTATGVRVETGGKSYVLTAKEEVVVSAGALKSPQLLMLSGIGPEATLQANNIPVRSKLEGVGQNMHDHVLAAVGYHINVPTLAQLADYSWAREVREQYMVNHTGPLTAPGSVIGWERLSARNDSGLSVGTIRDLEAAHPADWPQVEFIPTAGAGPVANPSDIPPDFGNVLVALVAPFSRGTVTINSTDGTAPPVINPNWLVDPRDGEVMVAGLKRARSIWHEMSGVMIGDEVFPGSNVTSDADILAYARGAFSTVWHPSSTCKMGKPDDPMAVVDSQSRVFGVNSMRVVDASAFPFLTPGHPQSVVYMLAEKIADDILRGR